MPLHVHAATDVGRERSVNEDSHAALSLDAERHLLLVCDGMGGHEGGRLASSTATDALVKSLSTLEDQLVPAAIFEALHRANESVIASAVAHGMPTAGSTAVLAVVEGDHYWMGWVGDSRLYHLRGREIVERSRDHTRVAEMVERGILTPEEAHAHPDAHILSSALGAGKALEDPFKVSAIQDRLELAVGDVLVLCSDGLYDLVSDAELPELLAGLDVAEGADRLIATANARGGHDNITVIVACWGTRVVPALVHVAVAPPEVPAEPTPNATLPPIYRERLERTPPLRATAPALQRAAAPRPRPTPGPSRVVDVAIGVLIGLAIGTAFGWFLGVKLPQIRTDWSEASESPAPAKRPAARSPSPPAATPPARAPARSEAPAAPPPKPPAPTPETAAPTPETPAPTPETP